MDHFFKILWNITLGGLCIIVIGILFAGYETLIEGKEEIETQTIYKDNVNNTKEGYTSIKKNDKKYIGFDGGYEWAEENDPTAFDECQYQFSTSDEEDGCNKYVKDNYEGYEIFHGYECTEDCSGHKAGYEWAEENGIDDESDCGGNSNSFIEGCISYVNGE